MTMSLTRKTYAGQVKAAEADTGVFEAIVATYDVDSYGDKIVPGAFADTLAAWAASGDPIPVIWSHMSADPNAHIGVVEAAEERPGVGLWVRGALDLDAPTAAYVHKLLKARRITQFSFAYDVEEGAWIESADEPSYYELRKLKLYEVGPTLIGVNQATELLSVKSREAADPLALAARIAAKADGGLSNGERAQVAALMRAGRDPRDEAAIWADLCRKGVDTAAPGGPASRPGDAPDAGQASPAITARTLAAWVALETVKEHA
ncbi:MAG: HK97 family phage prohead protease [Pseudonocardiaceae bacterium]|nr:MAG: HK97 family phage prohead protease [Pseudonocardiaceae bacterium]